jgi:hypothetical protein
MTFLYIIQEGRNSNALCVLLHYFSGKLFDIEFNHIPSHVRRSVSPDPAISSLGKGLSCSLNREKTDTAMLLGTIAGSTDDCPSANG